MHVQLTQERTRGRGVERVANALEQWRHQHKHHGPRWVDTTGIGRPASFGVAEEMALEKTVWQRKLPKLAVNKATLFFEADMDSASGEHATEEDPVGDLQEKVRQLYTGGS